MGGTVLDMFTLDATPLSLSPTSYSFSGRAIQSYPTSPSRFPSPSSSIYPSLFFAHSPLSFFFYFREFSQKRHANTRSASDQLCRAGESRRETLEF